MAVALVGVAGAVTQGASGAAVTPAYGQTPTANNLLICQVATGFSATLPTTPAGWTIAKQVAGTLCTSTTYYKVAAGADTAPTIALIASTVIAARLMEFSGLAASTPLDQTASATGTTTPIVATTGAVDAAAAELVVYTAAVRYSLNGAVTLTHTLNNGATVLSDANDAAATSGTGGANKYDFCYGVTTGKASADSDSFAFTTTNISGAALTVASFTLAPVVAAATGPSYLPRLLGPGAVGPTFFAALQPPYLPYFTDAVTGSIVFGGAAGDAKVGADSRSGSIIFGGTPADAKTGTDAVTGAIIFGGLAGDQYTLSLPSVNQYLPFSLGPVVPVFFARFPPSPNPAAPGFSIFTDTVTGSIIFQGTPAETATFSVSPSGAIIFGGAPGEAKTGTDATAGTIIFGGLSGDQYTLSLPFVNQYLPFSLGPGVNPLFFAKFPPPPSPPAVLAFNFTDTPTGAIIFGGAPGEAKRGTDSPTGAIIFGGAANDQKIGADVRSGALIFGGSLTPVTIYRVSPTGAIIFAGSVIEASGHFYLDLPIGTIIFGGTAIPDHFIPPPYRVQRFFNAANRNFS